MEWEKVTMFVQRHPRTGVIVSMQEEPPAEYLLKLENERKEVRKAVHERIENRVVSRIRKGLATGVVRNVKEIGD